MRYATTSGNLPDNQSVGDSTYALFPRDYLISVMWRTVSKRML